jgi:diguanylate cyclase (GGDEF)-like protein
MSALKPGRSGSRSNLVQLSFRRRLTLFFLLIVVLPMVAVGVLVIGVTEESTTGKADARLGAELESALSIYQQSVADARASASDIARDERFAEALASGDRGQIDGVASVLAAEHGATSLRISDRRGREVAAVGRRRPFAAFELELARGGEDLGALDLSTTSPAAYLAQVENLLEDDFVIVGTDGPVAGTLPAQNLQLPAAGAARDVLVDGELRRAAATELPASDGLRVVAIGELGTGGFLASSPGIAAALVVFFAVALLFVAMLTRALQGQVATMLDAARRIGQGDFSQEVPVVGRDEMAGLAREFNKMSGRVSEQMEELRRQRVEIERSVERLGEAFAAGLDRSALLGIVVETAISACEATYGRVLVSEGDGAEAESGDAPEPMQKAAAAAEERATRERANVAARHGDAHAIAGPLARIGRPEDVIGTMTVARDGRPFDDAQRDVFRYLLGQASASVENVALHEVVSEQAVTDELTGLANSRAFRDVIDKEAARAWRFGHDLALLMLDIDDFKRVNDTHGHLQGDEILRTLGRILASESRGVDEPARYGGEEFVVALPETDAEGALELGERIRARLEAEPIPRVDGDGALRVTASLGVATLPGSADDVRGLIAAADEALYEAKRAGKNQVRIAKGRVGARRR